jgi:hypothetical protein
MQMSQGNSLCNYLNQTKCLFFFYKINEQESVTGPAWVVGVVPMGGGKRLGKCVGGEYSANIVYTHMQMKKMIAVDAIQAMG